MFIIIFAISFIVVAGFVSLTAYGLSLRRIVPTNVVHIVQRGNKTVSYGVGKESNVYYEFPKWLPIYGVEVRELPVSNFGIDLPKYSAYDKDRVPFEVDIKAFFHIADTNKAAEKVASYQDLLFQLTNVVQGAVRSILAKSPLDKIMEERSIFGKLFTEAVTEDLKSWGVEPIKSIELMDVRDIPGSNVIHQIMAKKISVIDMESRTEVAKNSKLAQQAELVAKQEIALTAADTERIAGEAQAKSQEAIGIAKAVSVKNRGIADQSSLSEIAKAEKVTAEQNMEVVKVNQIRTAEIEKERQIINTEQQKRQVEIAAEANRFKVETDATAALAAKQLEATGIRSVGEAQADVVKANGLASAEAKKQMELANVSAQTTLAKEIGENKPYQDYLIRVKEVEVSQVVGVAQYKSIAEALSKADLKLLVNSGDVQSGIGKLSDIFTSKGASQINGLVEGLKQTDEGQALLTGLEKLIPGIKSK